jgi:hypothetical protein
VEAERRRVGAEEQQEQGQRPSHEQRRQSDRTRCRIRALRFHPQGDTRRSRSLVESRLHSFPGIERMPVARLTPAGGRHRDLRMSVTYAHYVAICMLNCYVCHPSGRR